MRNKKIDEEKLSKLDLGTLEKLWNILKLDRDIAHNFLNNNEGNNEGNNEDMEWAWNKILLFSAVNRVYREKLFPLLNIEKTSGLLTDKPLKHRCHEILCDLVNKKEVKPTYKNNTEVAQKIIDVLKDERTLTGKNKDSIYSYVKHHDFQLIKKNGVYNLRTKSPIRHKEK